MLSSIPCAGLEIMAGHWTMCGQNWNLCNLWNLLVIGQYLAKILNLSSQIFALLVILLSNIDPEPRYNQAKPNLARRILYFKPCCKIRYRSKGRSEGLIVHMWQPKSLQHHSRICCWGYSLVWAVDFFFFEKYCSSNKILSLQHVAQIQTCKHFLLKPVFLLFIF